MASTAEATNLTEQHRRRQLALRAATIRDLLTIWQAFSVENMAATWPAVETALVALIQARWAVSAGMAAAYYGEFRAAEGFTDPFVPRVAPVPSALEVAVPLRIAGPRSAGKLIALARPDAAAVTLTNVAGEVSRQTLNGGRATILDTIDADPVALGYARVTDGDPCAFCAMLASRGFVYKSKQTATVDRSGQKYHKKCACGAEPTFDRGSALPGKAQEFAETWKQAKRKARQSGDRPDIEFRRLIENR